MATKYITTLSQVYNELSQGAKLKDKYKFRHAKKTKDQEIVTTLGRIWFNLLLPEDYPFVDEPIGKKMLNNKILKNILDKYGPEEAAKVVKRIYEEAFKLSCYLPVTFEFEKIEPPKYLLEKRNELVKWIEREDPKPDEVMQKIKELQKEYEKWLQENDVLLYYAVKGGAKGSLADWSSMTLIRGYTTNVKGEISKKPIIHSMNEGYDIEEWLNAANQSRRALYLQSTHAAEPGYLARRVVFACDHIEISSDDCGTTKYWKIHVNERIAQSIKGRYYIDGSKLKRIDNPEKLIGKDILLRSPLYCKDKNGICAICYGDLWKELETRRVGIIAGAITNTVLLGLNLKAKHRIMLFDIEKVNFIERLKGNDEAFKLLDIKETEIRAKEPSIIYIDKSEYRELVDLPDYIVIPGVFSIQVGNKEVSIGVPFNVKVFKTANTEETEEDILIRYDKGDIIIKQEYADVSPSFDAVEKLLEARAKYIKNPEILVNLVHELMSRAKPLDLVHCEVIVANMFRRADNPREPCRIRGSYKNAVVIGQTKLPFIDSWLKAVAFENIDYALTNALIDGKSAKGTPLEKVLLADLLGSES